MAYTKEENKRMEALGKAVERLHKKYNKRVDAKINKSNKLNHEAYLLRQQEEIERKSIYETFRRKK